MMMTMTGQAFTLVSSCVGFNQYDFIYKRFLVYSFCLIIICSSLSTQAIKRALNIMVHSLKK